MKHVLKRLLDRVESNSLNIDQFRSQLGSVNIYFDTCDLELYASVRGSIDSDMDITTSGYSLKKLVNQLPEMPSWTNCTLLLTELNQSYQKI